MTSEMPPAASLQAEVNRLRLELQSLRATQTEEPIEIGNYILARLKQLNVKQIFGVPGDFNLGFLDLVEADPAIGWVGNCNELNAAYAADGYARVNETRIGVVLTTFGVGELSAMNGIAGAFSEMVPVLHLVGVPSTAQQRSKALLHHTLGDGRYDAYVKAAANVTITQGIIVDAENAGATIDRVLIECITKARPAYLSIPTNLVYAKIPSERLENPLSHNQPPNDVEAEKAVLEEIVQLVDRASANDSVVILVDVCAVRHDARSEVNELARNTGFPVYAAPMGKTVVPEDYERYGGIYIGSISDPTVKAKVEAAELILSVGCVKSDFNTGNFTYSIPASKTVEFHSDQTKVRHAVFPGVGMKQLIPRLTAMLEPFGYKNREITAPQPFRVFLPHEDSETITQDWLWPRVSQFFRPKDVIVAETGTSNFGLIDVPLPSSSIFVSQLLWGSIGWATGCTLGAAFAARERDLGRTILFTGDGSIQLTVQELSSMVRHGLTPIVFVLNNNGYEIERCIRGWEAGYNDIMNWEWTSLLRTLGDVDGSRSKSYRVRTKKELSVLLDDEAFAAAGKIQLVEIVMRMHDAPRALRVQAEMGQEENVYGY
ncbi:Pyruvate decarboxylase [Mycena indigotica]|uniref:Pyruvate decarboxylase n=1 Tax=Mycena indigotica TaxID=2126181 RepID=A0A8H6SEC8_9AGAR|nr:Pyruvate decarboxylase [Mycena indigotica]KAF7297397.1 Pyruvate decarboxylase [Mycena indigotica]